MTTITLDSTISTAPGHISTTLGDEMVILSQSSGVYFGLNAVGSVVWRLIAQPRTVTAICDAITAEFDVDRATCEADVLALLERLSEQGLINIR
jgi:hypothetical protein